MLNSSSQINSQTDLKSFLNFFNIIYLPLFRSESLPTCSTMQKMWASSCWKRLTRVKPLKVPESSFLWRTPKSANRTGISLQDRGRWANIRLEKAWKGQTLHDGEKSDHLTLWSQVSRCTNASCWLLDQQAVLSPMTIFYLSFWPRDGTLCLTY